MPRIKMIKCFVKGQRRFTTCRLPHSSGLFPVWYSNGRFADFVKKSEVKFPI